MTTITISLPETMKEFINEQVSGSGFGTVSEYLRGLIRDDQKRQAQARLEQLLLEGLASPKSEWTKQDWTDMRNEVIRRHGERRRG